MKKWYLSAPCKWSLIVAAHVCAAMLLVGVCWFVNRPLISVEELLGKRERFEDTESFEEQFLNTAQSVAWASPEREQFGPGGVADREKLVDLQIYEDEDRISGEDVNGVAYRLGDLLDWYDYGLNEAENAYGLYDYEEHIIVCQKTDKTFQYYRFGEFENLLTAGELQFSGNALEYWGEEDSLAVLMRLVDSAEENAFSSLLDRDGREVYTSCWLYNGYRLAERYAPVGAEGLLQIVNEQEEWNGRLQELYRMLRSTIQNIGWRYQDIQNVQDVLTEGNTNFFYLLVDLEGQKVYTNRAEYQDFQNWEANAAQLTQLGRYVQVTPRLSEFTGNLANAEKQDSDAREWRDTIGSSFRFSDYVCTFAVDTGYPVQDTFYQAAHRYQQDQPLARTMMGLALTGLVGFLVCLVWLTLAAGRSARTEELCLCVLDKGKTELFLVVAAALLTGVALLFAAICEEMLRFTRVYNTNLGHEYYDAGWYVMINFTPGSGAMVINVVILSLAAVLACSAFLLCWLSLVRRVKARSLWSNSLTKSFVSFLWRIFRNINVIWKTVLAAGTLTLLLWITMWSWSDGLKWIMFFLSLVVLAYVLYQAVGVYQIRKGIRAVAGGDVAYQIPLKGLFGGQRQMAESVNTIGDGLERAVAQSMKDERMKTDLITNVSHDIKTPLTSIINYVELLKRENIPDEKVQGYIKVLEEKSQRLKTLTEDVVEASKVSSGNIKLDKTRLNLVELINQASGELEEKFEARDLSLLVSMPAEPVTVFADGRRMWRVFSNIFGNAAKYALPGTRVYADLYREGIKVVFSLKNISEQQLNITADELMERFTRGDLSRSTEGSGLGLSIAKNLTELQGGQFELYLDGDLFKVVIRMDAEGDFTEYTEVKK